MQRPVVLQAITAAFLVVTPAAAQICEGSPPLGSNAAAVIGGGASFVDGAKTYSGGASFGGDVYGGASLGYTDIDNSTYSLKQVSAGVGFDASDGGPVSVCPRLSAGYAFGLKVQGVDLTTWVVTPGLALGFRSDVTETMAVVPGAMASFVYQKLSLDAGIGGEYEDSRTYGAISPFLTFLFNDRLGLQPSVTIPVGRDDGDTSFGIGIALAVGGN